MADGTSSPGPEEELTGQERPADPSPQGGSEDDEAAWFLDDDWEIFWWKDYGAGCLTFFDAWGGAMKFEEDVAEFATRAHRNASISQARRRLDLDKLKAAGPLLAAKSSQKYVPMDEPWLFSDEAPPADFAADSGVATAEGEASVDPGAAPASAAEADEAERRPLESANDAASVGTEASVEASGQLTGAHRATSSTAAPESVAEPEEVGTDYLVDTTKKPLKLKQHLSQGFDDRFELSPEDDRIQFYEWDDDLRFRKCRIPRLGKDFFWAGRTISHVLQPAHYGHQNLRLPFEPLMLAVAENDVEFLRRCIAKGQSVHGIQDAERTPLLCAAELGHADCCAILFLEGARDASAVGRALTQPLKALLLALSGEDEKAFDVHLLDEQVEALLPDIRPLVEQKLDEIAKKQRQLRPPVAQAKSPRLELKLPGISSAFAEEKRSHRHEVDKVYQEQLEREAEEEDFHKRKQEEAQRRRRALAQERMREEQEEAARQERLEEKRLEERRRKVAEAKRLKEEADTAAVIARLQEAQRSFLASLSSQEQREQQEMQARKMHFQQKLEARQEFQNQEEQEQQRLHEERMMREEERKWKAELQMRLINEEKAQEELQKKNVEQLQNLFEQQKEEAWTCMECGNDSVNHPDLPGSCMFCGTPRDQGLIAKTWEGWTWAGSSMVRTE